MSSPMFRRRQQLQLQSLHRLFTLCAAAGLTWRLTIGATWPSAFFASPPMTPGTAESSSAGESVPAAGDRQPNRHLIQGQWKSIHEGPKYLKLLVRATHRFKPMELQEKHGAIVKLSGRGEYFPYVPGASKALLVTGEQEDVLAVLEDLFSDGSDEKRAVVFLVPRSTGGQLIGNGGEKVTKIQEATSAQISIKQAGFEELVSVYGNLQSIKAVAEWLLNEQTDFTDEMKQHLTINYMGVQERGLDAECSIFMGLPEAKAYQLMGKGGAVIQSIRQEFKVGLMIDQTVNDADGNKILKISGPASSVYAAHSSILHRFVLEKNSRWKRKPRRASVAEAADALAAASAEPVAAAEEPAVVGVGPAETA